MENKTVIKYLGGIVKKVITSSIVEARVKTAIRITFIGIEVFYRERQRPASYTEVFTGNISAK